jgi:hypothetical protein
LIKTFQLKGFFGLVKIKIKYLKEKVVPVCSYVVTYINRHPETHDLLKTPIEESVAACRLPNQETTN